VLRDLVENLLALVVPSFFSSRLALTELVFGSFLVGGLGLAALNNAVVVIADSIEVLLTKVLATIFSSSHSLAKLCLDFETLSFLKTLSSSLSKCNSVLGGKTDLLQFLALCSSVLKLFVNILESDLFLGDEESVLEF